MSNMLTPLRDIRLRGFGERVPVDEAIKWVDSHPANTNSEEIPTGAACGRFLVQPFVAPADAPAVDLAARDGYALLSAETVGAGGYNPLLFHIRGAESPLGAFSAVLVSAGTPLPPGADAVAPFELVRVATDIAELLGPVARGTGVILAGQEARKGAILIDTSRPLRPSDLGLISSFGIELIRVIRHPMVRLVVTGPNPSGNPADANGPMLRALVARDGGLLESCTYGATKRDDIARLIARPGADVILVCGRTGTGADDEAPLALDVTGTLSIHGIALRPGGSCGMGSAGGVPVILLPGSPLACYSAYDLFAGRLIRRLGGRCSQLPYRIRKARAGRKIVSSVGDVEFCRVRFVAEEVIPIGSANAGGLASVARADGFVLVPAPLEGYAPGTLVDVYMYGSELEITTI